MAHSGAGRWGRVHQDIDRQQVQRCQGLSAARHLRRSLKVSNATQEERVCVFAISMAVDGSSLLGMHLNKLSSRSHLQGSRASSLS
nr:hypothetical protein KRP22_10877 [Phytophthora ramorum]